MGEHRWPKRLICWIPTGEMWKGEKENTVVITNPYKKGF
jgi:hypothetical protein